MFWCFGPKACGILASLPGIEPITPALDPDDYVRKQTLVNAERFITPELKEMESRILGASDKAVALEKQLFEELRTFARTFTGEIQKAAFSVARLDVLTALGECASKYRYCTIT